MNMVARAANRQCFHAIGSCDSAHVGPEPWLNFVGNQGTPGLCGKDAMKE